MVNKYELERAIIGALADRARELVSPAEALSNADRLASIAAALAISEVAVAMSNAIKAATERQLQELLSGAINEGDTKQ